MHSEIFGLICGMPSLTGTKETIDGMVKFLPKLCQKAFPNAANNWKEILTFITNLIANSSNIYTN